LRRLLRQEKLMGIKVGQVWLMKFPPWKTIYFYGRSCKTGDADLELKQNRRSTGTLPVTEQTVTNAANPSIFMDRDLRANCPLGHGSSRFDASFSHLTGDGIV
jgi:hypothetical protein